MKIRHTPALVLVATTVFLLACTAAWAQNSTKLFTANPDKTSQPPASDGQYVSFGTATVDLQCQSGEDTAILTSNPTQSDSGYANVFTDNFINLTTGTGDGQVTRNVCTGGYQDGTGGSADQTPGAQHVDGQSTCFNGNFGGVAQSSLGKNIDPNAYGVPSLDISPYLTQNGTTHMQFDLIDFGGEFGNSDVYLVTSCTINPQPTAITHDTPPGQTTTFNFGPFQQKVTPKAGQPDLTLTITATPEPSGFTLGPNFSGPNFPGGGAKCVPYQQTGGSGADQCWLLQVSCTGGSCPTDPTTIDALLANSFDTSTPITNGPGFLKTESCNPSTGGCVFTSNQISEYHANQHDPIVKAPTSPPGGYSFWIVTQNTPNDPLITITSPTATTYTQGQAVASDYKCDPANPVTTSIASCAGPVTSGSNIDTSTPGPHTFTVTATDALTNNPNCVFDSTVGMTTTTIPGCPTGHETSSKTVHYTVMGTAPVDLAIKKGGPRSVKKNTNFDYGILVWNGGANPSSGPVTITDHLPLGVTVVGTKGLEGYCTSSSLRSCTSAPVNCVVSGQAVTGQTVTCTLPKDLIPSKVNVLNGAVIGITVNASAAGPVSNTATVSSFDADTNSSNNSSTANTTITN